MNAFIKNMYWIFLKVLQNEQRAVFVIQRLYSVFIQKEYVIENVVLERMQGSISSC